MDDLMKELEADLRMERWQRVWRSFGSLMIGLSVAVVLGTMAMVYWQHRQAGARTEMTSQLLKGIDRIRLEDTQGAVAAFSSMPADSSGVAQLARLRHAEMLVKARQPDKAAEIYRALAADAGADPASRDLASILAQTTGSAQPAKESAPVPGSPFYFTANELAALHALDHGKRDDALARLSDLRLNALAPFSLRERAGELLAYLAPTATASETKDKDTTP